ncbi:collagen, type xiii, alpha 1 [Stigmatella aurantiaca DW4/3-1]|uniref:Collagen, type xiii, alpha 1 n=1 Tax=Stigmatella aurantiaca (strain DW4/3-1) TaxID=378806 RepID=Q08TC7_STIAD|nr:collagen, type xiii, alpha 1 [Stigmatella aurantiaca DW4/3-1]
MRRRRPDQRGIRGGEEHLGAARGQVAHQVRVALRIQLARHIVEQQQGQEAQRGVEVFDLGDLPAQHQRALLSLAGVGTRAAAPQRHRHVVHVRPHRGEAPLQVPPPAPRQRLQQGIRQPDFVHLGELLGQVRGVVTIGGWIHRAPDGRERGLGPGRQLGHQGSAPHVHPGPRARERLIVGVQVRRLRRGPVAQQPVAVLQRPGVVPALLEERREAVEHRPVQEGAPRLRPSLHHLQIIGREGHHRDAAEVLLQAGGLLAIHEGLPHPTAHLHGDLPLGPLEQKAARDPGPFRPPAHQLRQPARAQRLERGQEIEGLQQVRLALAVLSHGDGGVRARGQGDLVQVAEILGLERKQAHGHRHPIRSLASSGGLTCGGPCRLDEPGQILDVRADQGNRRRLVRGEEPGRDIRPAPQADEEVQRLAHPLHVLSLLVPGPVGGRPEPHPGRLFVPGPLGTAPGEQGQLDGQLEEARAPLAEHLTGLQPRLRGVLPRHQPGQQNGHLLVLGGDGLQPRLQQLAQPDMGHVVPEGRVQQQLGATARRGPWHPAHLALQEGSHPARLVEPVQPLPQGAQRHLTQGQRAAQLVRLGAVEGQHPLREGALEDALEHTGRGTRGAQLREVPGENLHGPCPGPAPQERASGEHLFLQGHHRLAQQGRQFAVRQPPLHGLCDRLAQVPHLVQEPDGGRLPGPALGGGPAARGGERSIHLGLRQGHLAQQLQVGPEPLFPEKPAQDAPEGAVAQP